VFFTLKIREKFNLTDRIFIRADPIDKFVVAYFMTTMYSSALAVAETKKLLTVSDAEDTK